MGALSNVVMNIDPTPFHRRSIRLKDYDYSSPGSYFVTVLAYKRECLFGNVVSGKMRLNQYGKILYQSWEWLPRRYPYIMNEIFVIMPNHFHGILQILEVDDYGKGGSRPALTIIKPLGQLIGAFKTISAKQINISRGTPGFPVWHRNYYEHIIRNQSDLESIADYILANPTHWTDDLEFIQ